MPMVSGCVPNILHGLVVCVHVSTAALCCVGMDIRTVYIEECKGQVLQNFISQVLRYEHSHV